MVICTSTIFWIVHNNFSLRSQPVSPHLVLEAREPKNVADCLGAVLKAED